MTGIVVVVVVAYASMVMSSSAGGAVGTIYVVLDCIMAESSSEAGGAEGSTGRWVVIGDSFCSGRIACWSAQVPQTS